LFGFYIKQEFLDIVEKETMSIRGIYNYVLYGRQIGKTANNGSKAFKRGARVTGLNANGDVIRTVITKKKGKDIVEILSKTPYGNDRYKQTRVVRDSHSGVIYWDKYDVDEYGQREYAGYSMSGVVKNDIFSFTKYYPLGAKNYSVPINRK